MLLPDWNHLIFTSLRYNPLKSLLTALGIAIGIAAVTLLTSLGEGVRSYVMDNFSQFGTRIIAIGPGKNNTSGMGGILSSVRLLTLDDYQSLKTLPYADHVVANVQGTGPVRFGERIRNTDIYGTTASMVEAWDFPLASGRFLPNSPGNNSPAFAVLGSKVWQELFEGRNALGQFIRVGGQRFRVIGVMQPKGSMLGFDLDDMVYIPADRALSLFNREGLMEIDVVFSPATSSEQMSERIRQRLIDRHGQEDFTIVTQDEMLSSLNSILSVLTLGVAALGSISLLVGGVGIFTIMTTNIRERTPEIGLLRAIGTSRRQLLSLFLGEAVFLAILGALGGMLTALLLLGITAMVIPDFPVQPSPFYLVASLLFSAFIGLIAGIGPAWKASNLSPIEALRDE
ncbi:ABC transporter permease [Thalassolituus marinus]|uniref:ABC transporter permease n=1 Tax=Thalassolituus marinus TaxID=671053 RepID=A0ABS7ZR16_9GAMM|nr:ABC transporter permease [Thalassolituus marinus]MCA6064161.1 ABC transporter permease [Thalassolituus marinus]